MTRSEARTETSRQLSNARETLKLAKSQGAKTRTQNKIDYLVAVQKALCEPSREMAEKVWRGEWINTNKEVEQTCMCKCSKCGYPISYFWSRTQFCPNCGTPMTDEAVEMVMRRLEALYDKDV